VDDEVNKHKVDRFTLRLLAEEDRIFAQARMEYEKLTAEQRAQLRRAVSDALGINSRLNATGIAAFAPQFQLLSIVEGASSPDLTSIDPIPLHVALSAWDRGEEYMPSVWGHPPK
jgi:hypothetical protein